VLELLQSLLQLPVNKVSIISIKLFYSCNGRNAALSFHLLAIRTLLLYRQTVFDTVENEHGLYIYFPRTIGLYVYPQLHSP
jgi:hypothetical protein